MVFVSLVLTQSAETCLRSLFNYTVWTEATFQLQSTFLDVQGPELHP